MKKLAILTLTLLLTLTAVFAAEGTCPACGDALGTLINVTGTEDVASAYAATYPISLISVVLASQFIIIFFS